MAKQGAKAVTPRLRFPEFRDASAWEKKPLSILLDYERPDKYIVADTAYGNCGTPVLTANKSFILGYTNETDGICSNVPAIIFDDFTTDKKFVDFPFKVKSSAIKILRAKDNDSLKLIFELMRGLKFDPKEHKRYYISEYQDLEVEVPAQHEQQKIADCMTSLDEVIAAQGRKVEALKAHKRGLMQQLFPREGETRPRLRFPEFRDAPEWKEIPLGGLVDLLSGYPFEGKDIVEDSAGERLMRGINITEGAIRHSAEIDRYYLGSTIGIEKFRLQKNDLVIGMDGSKVGKNSALISDADAGALLIQRVARLRAESAALMNFIFQQIHSPRFHAYVDRINTSSGIPHISAKQIREYPIHSTNEAEQQRIADCLSSLDTQITAESHQLAALKTHKQGLMQQLFPAPDAATT